VIYEDDATERETQRMADLLEVHKAINRLVQHGHVTRMAANRVLDLLHMESDGGRS
jgi:hypothetical protein